MDTIRICPQCQKPLPPEAPQGLCPLCLAKVALPSEATTVVGSAPADAPRPTLTAAAAPVEPPAPAALAPHFPQLEILELLGAGGMGMVYKARQPQLDRFVALKILSPEIAAKDPAFADRFLREARALARLNHPNIVAVYDFGVTTPPASQTPDARPHPPSGYFYFIMEFMDGANLRQLLANHEITPREALSIIPKVCDALQFAHDEGVMHRDIKPENILLDRKGRVKIADFGLAKLFGAEQAAHSTLTHTGVVMGTPRYMAPEQIEKPQAVDHRADIYSLGVVFYEMLTGELPLGRFEPPSHKVGVDVRLDEVVLRSLEKKPERRYQRASEVKTDVESIAGSAPPPAAAPAAFAAPAAAAGLDEARERVSGPATALFVIGLLNCALPLLLVLALVFSIAFGSGVGLAGAELALMTGGILFGPVILFAARGMKRLRGREFAVFASILAMVPITSPLFLVGIPIGIWCLVTLNKREVKEAFRRCAAEVKPPETAAPARPRFSRKAIVGAVWAMFAALALPSWLVMRPVLDARTIPAAAPVQLASSASAGELQPLLAQTTIRQENTWGERSKPTFLFYVGMLCTAIGLAAPIGTTVMGLMALHDIRHSKGMITGLPLALADALLFPLAALGGLIYWLCHLMNQVMLEFASASALIRNETLVPPAALVVWLAVSVVIVWLAWRAAKKPVAG